MVRRNLGPLVLSLVLAYRTFADGDRGWIVSTHPARLFTLDQAIKALTVTIQEIG